MSRQFLVAPCMVCLCVLLSLEASAAEIRAELAPEEVAVGVGGSRSLTVHLTRDGQPVAGHRLEWAILEVGDEDLNPVPRADWGTYGTVTSGQVTDARGDAVATFTAGTRNGDVSLAVRDGERRDADGAPVLLAQATVMIARLDHLEVRGAYRMGKTKEWAAGVTAKEAYVEVTAVMKPDLWSETPGANELVTWSGAGKNLDAVSRQVTRTAAGKYVISASSPGGKDSVTVYVCKPTGISVVSGAVQPEGAADAVTEADKADTAGVVVEARLQPSLTVVPQQLLFWDGGVTVKDHPERLWVRKTAPVRKEVTCRCGDASVSIRVWAVKVNLSAAGVSDSEEDATPASVTLNSDDDNRNELEDRLENPVAEENDMLTFLAMLAPDGLPKGKLALSPAPTGVALWKVGDKSQPLPSSWEPYQVPVGIFVEGTEVSPTPGDKHFTLTYTWGPFQAQDTVHLTVVPRPGMQGLQQPGAPR